MNLFETNIRNYWNYYLELEYEFIQTKRFVDFSSKNYATFSIEFLKLFQAICSEIDVVGKYLASIINKNFIRKDCKSIRQWWNVIQDELQINLEPKHYFNPSKSLSNIKTIKVVNNSMNEVYSPWAGFEVEEFKDSRNRTRIHTKEKCSTPKWWSDYNAVKHHRTEQLKPNETNYEKANLKNVCESIAALYLLELAVIELSASRKTDLERFVNESQLFEKKEFASYEDALSILKGAK